MQIGDLQKAKSFLQEALEINMNIGNFNGIGAAWNNLAYIALSEGNIDAAEEAGNQALVYYDQSGNRRGRGEALGNLIGVAIHNQDYDAAEDLCLQCIRLYRDMNLPVAPFVKEQGRIALAKNDLEKAQKYFAEALSSAGSISLKLGILTGFGEMLIKAGETEVGRQLLVFVVNHGSTEPEILSRAESALIGVPMGQVTVDLPNSLEAWEDHLIGIEIRQAVMV